MDYPAVAPPVVHPSFRRALTGSHENSKMSLQGRLEDLSLSDIFQIITLSKRTGVLTVSGSGKGRVVFRQGQILYASVYNREKLGERLIRKGLIEESDLEEALKIQKERRIYEPLGTILAGKKAASQDILETAIREQMQEVIYELLSWKSGTFRFEQEESPDVPVPQDRTLDILLDKGVSTEYLLLEGARLHDEEESGFSSSEKEVPPPISMEQRQIQRPDCTSTMVSLLKELMICRDASEVALIVLRFAGDIFSRVLMLTVRREQILGLGHSGFFIPLGGEDFVRRIRIPLKEPSVFDQALRNGIYKGKFPDSEWDLYLASQWGGELPGEIFVAPIMGKKGVEAFLYGDDFPRSREVGNTEELEVFIDVAGLVLIHSRSQQNPENVKTLAYIQ